MWPFKKPILPSGVPTPKAAEHVLTPRVTVSDIVPPAPSFLMQPRVVLLKKLKWVTNKGRVGIVADLDSSGYAEVHYTDAEGQTVEVDRVNSTVLQIAKFAEIPEPRRANLSQVYAATLGYF